MSLYQLNLRYKYCNLAFMHCLFDILALFVVPFTMFAVSTVKALNTRIDNCNNERVP